ncbi:hypothetical protein [Pseudobacteroides cellulosolvens]|uniref:Lipoprotein n=1 Tax=Pseudobacteroides cellulosolvens ATCC 35603 = DSM 2933 TaxID=398512 RepID=A0A0L6JJV9_9FIRM|nr:hypothetical protein [Pseudobacteroides cellulosolvens]KNY26049.1 hypothetical protein Bccel_1311 [Pseudobacteroides cellulosolvens ATCC 35603 = DSM 2933]
MKKLVLIIALTFVTFISGCSSASTEQKNTYGDNKLIQKEGDSYSFFDRIGDQDDSKLNIKYSRFYGAETIWNINVEKQGELKFQLNSEVDKGKFKGVIISQKNEITTIFEGEKKGSHSIILPEGMYRFKIVGYDANGKVDVELKLDENMRSTVIKDD